MTAAEARQAVLNARSAEGEVRGALISADAINTQRSTANHLVEDYLLAVKAAQVKSKALRSTLLQRCAQRLGQPPGVSA